MGLSSQPGSMRFLSILPFLVGFCISAPQQVDLDVVAEIFGDASRQGGGGGYGDTNSGGGKGGVTSENSGSSDSDSYPSGNADIHPADYVEPDSNSIDKASVEVNDQFENCAEYTEQYGYECVPYYQCHNGTIITDGAGLIDIRGGFGELHPEDSKCPGFLDVCCKDPDFIPPPPPPIVKYAPKCGRRNQAGLGARIQGFTESESQFGEWPHMCAVLHAKPVEQEPSYSGEPETVNLYQCGGSLIAPGVILTAAHCVDKFRQNPTELRSGVESGTLSTSQNLILIRTETFRTSPFIQSLMVATCKMTSLFSSSPRTLFWISIWTLLVCQLLMKCLMAQHVSPLAGARISSEQLDSIRWC